MLELDAFWDRRLKLWTIIVIDENGFQMFDAEYCANSDQLAAYIGGRS